MLWCVNRHAGTPRLALPTPEPREIASCPASVKPRPGTEQGALSASLQGGICCNSLGAGPLQTAQLLTACAVKSRIPGSLKVGALHGAPCCSCCWSPPSQHLAKTENPAFVGHAVGLTGSRGQSSERGREDSIQCDAEDCFAAASWKRRTPPRWLRGQAQSLPRVASALPVRGQSQTGTLGPRHGDVPCSAHGSRLPSCVRRESHRTPRPGTESERPEGMPGEESAPALGREEQLRPG